jgi:hypothetical protein
MNSVTPFGTMMYNGLQSSVRKRIGASLFGANYTFSRAIDNSVGDNGDGFIWRAYPTSYVLNKQLSGISRSQVFNLYWVYDLPLGQGHELANHGIAKWILGGWQIRGILNRFSGLPFSVGTTASVNAFGQGTSAAQIKPNVAILGGHNSSNPYFDGTAFINPAANTLAGTVARDTLRGPGLFALNASVAKMFKFKEGRISFQLVGEAFNLTNTPVFSNPNATCNQSYPTATSCWTTNADGSTNFNGFGTITGTASSPRYLQVGGYLRF